MLNARVLQPRRSGIGGGGGSGAVSVHLTNASYYSNLDSYGGTAAKFELNASGMVVSASQASVPDYAWLLAGAAAGVEARCTVISGSIFTSTSSARGVWLSLASTRFWAVHKALGSRSALVLVELRRTSDFVVVASATISLSYDGADDSGTL